ERAVESCARDLADHHSAARYSTARWPLRRRALFSGDFRWVHFKAARGIEFIHQHTETLADDNLAACPSHSQFPSNQWNARFGWQHIDARQFHHFRDRTPCCHADAAPRSPINSDAACGRPGGAEAGRDLAEQIVGRTVVRLSDVAEASGN